MKLDELFSSHACSLELSKRLKELGVKQESLFYWISNLFMNKYFLSMEGGFSKEYHKDDFVSAFTASELGKMLPFEVVKNNEVAHLQMIKTIDGKWAMAYIIRIDLPPLVWIKEENEENEANVRAKMVILLLENNLIENNND